MLGLQKLEGKQNGTMSVMNLRLARLDSEREKSHINDRGLASICVETTGREQNLSSTGCEIAYTSRAALPEDPSVGYPSAEESIVMAWRCRVPSVRDRIGETARHTKRSSYILRSPGSSNLSWELCGTYFRTSSLSTLHRDISMGSRVLDTTEAADCVRDGTMARVVEVGCRSCPVCPALLFSQRPF